MTKEEKISMMEEAQEHLFRAMELIEEVFGDDPNVQAYMIDQIAVLASDEHGFLSGSLNIDELKERILNDE